MDSKRVKHKHIFVKCSPFHFTYSSLFCHYYKKKDSRDPSPLREGFTVNFRTVPQAVAAPIKQVAC